MSQKSPTVRTAPDRERLVAMERVIAAPLSDLLATTPSIAIYGYDREEVGCAPDFTTDTKVWLANVNQLRGLTKTDG